MRDAAGKIEVHHLKHLGLYVFQRDALLEYPTLPQGTLEKIEQLEQLRWLENGWKIRVAEVEHDSVSVDVPEDIAESSKNSCKNKTARPGTLTGGQIQELPRRLLLANHRAQYRRARVSTPTIRWYCCRSRKHGN